MSDAQPVEKASIIVMSGDMDKVMGAFIIATGAAAFDMQVSMFFTFWGLKAIQKGNLTGKGIMGKMLGVMNRGGIDRLNPSKLNFGGMGRWMFKKMMKKPQGHPAARAAQAGPGAGREVHRLRDEHERHGDQEGRPDRRRPDRRRRLLHRRRLGVQVLAVHLASNKG